MFLVLLSYENIAASSNKKYYLNYFYCRGVGVVDERGRLKKKILADERFSIIFFFKIKLFL